MAGLGHRHTAADSVEADHGRREGASMKRAVLVLACGATACSVVAGSATAQRTPVKLMVIAPVATPIQNVPDAEAGAQAAAAAINKAGGINGRAIQIEFCNTRSAVNAATQCARQAVSDQVVAVGRPTRTPTPLAGPIPPAGG